MVLCVGANAALFSVVDRVLLSPLPFANAARLVAVEDRHTGDATNLAYATFLEVAARNSTLDQVAAIRGWQFNLTGGGSEAERIDGARVSQAFFAALGTMPALGRAFDREEDAPGGPSVAVVGYSVWQARF